MTGNSYFAKFAVLLLIAINLGAYYLLWPANSPNPFTGEPAPGQTSLKSDDPVPDTPETSAALPAPKLLPSAVQIVAAPPEPETVSKPARDNGPGFIPAATLTLPEPARGADRDVVAVTPPLKQADPGLIKAAEPSAPTNEQQNVLDSLRKQVQTAQTEEHVPVGAAPVTNAFKLDNSPWSFQMEIVDGRTILRARLHKNAEFKVLCDRVEMKVPDSGVQAVGNVTIHGPALSASCQRLTLPLSGEHILLEGQAEAKIQDGSGWEIKGERLNLRPVGIVAQMSADQKVAPPASSPNNPAVPSRGDSATVNINPPLPPATLPFFPDPAPASGSPQR
jgi:hypothetical protein